MHFITLSVLQLIVFQHSDTNTTNCTWLHKVRSMSYLLTTLLSRCGSIILENVQTDKQTLCNCNCCLLQMSLKTTQKMFSEVITCSIIQSGWRREFTVRWQQLSHVWCQTHSHNTRTEEWRHLSRPLCSQLMAEWRTYHKHITVTTTPQHTEQNATVAATTNTSQSLQHHNALSRMLQ